MEKKYTKRDKIKLVKDINKCDKNLHEQIMRIIFIYENDNKINIPYDSNINKTMIDFSKLDDKLINQIENIYETYLSNLNYLKDTNSQYKQVKNDFNIVLQNN